MIFLFIYKLYALENFGRKILIKNKLESQNVNNIKMNIFGKKIVIYHSSRKWV
jgi:hypothetical protein